MLTANPMIQKQPLISRLSANHKFNLALKHFPAGISILEVGSGSGEFANRLNRQSFQVTTLDLKAPADIVGDIKHWRDTRYRSPSFDAVVALEVIEHVDCLVALTQICRPGGLIMLSSPHPDWDWLLNILEKCGLLQRRTSAHKNLLDFEQLPLVAVVRQRPMFFHQVAIFKNEARY